jgi:hypothetical protein
MIKNEHELMDWCWKMARELLPDDDDCWPQLDDELRLCIFKFCTYTRLTFLIANNIDWDNVDWKNSDYGICRVSTRRIAELSKTALKHAENVVADMTENDIPFDRDEVIKVMMRYAHPN